MRTPEVAGVRREAGAVEVHSRLQALKSERGKASEFREPGYRPGTRQDM